MSSVIPINERYRIELDTLSWQLSMWKPRKNHEHGGIWEGLSWHRTLQQAGDAATLRLIDQEELEGVQSIIDALDAASSLIALAISSSGLPDSWQDATNIQKGEVDDDE